MILTYYRRQKALSPRAPPIQPNSGSGQEVDSSHSWNVGPARVACGLGSSAPASVSLVSWSAQAGLAQSLDPQWDIAARYVQPRNVDEVFFSRAGDLGIGASSDSGAQSGSVAWSTSACATVRAATG